MTLRNTIIQSFTCVISRQVKISSTRIYEISCHKFFSCAPDLSLRMSVYTSVLSNFGGIYIAVARCLSPEDTSYNSRIIKMHMIKRLKQKFTNFKFRNIRKTYSRLLGTATVEKKISPPLRKPRQFVKL